MPWDVPPTDSVSCYLSPSGVERLGRKTQWGGVMLSVLGPFSSGGELETGMGWEPVYKVE